MEALHASGQSQIQAPFVQTDRVSERLDQLETESRARCVRRWCALGLTRDEALTLYNDPTVGAVPPAISPTPQQPVKLIQAAMGTGKSLIGERLHGIALGDFRREPNAPVPVYLETRPAVDKLRDALMAACGNLGDPAKRGISVVIDDQLAGDSASALQLLDEARYLAELWPHTIISILSRPLPDDRPPPEAVALPNLSADETTQLINRLGGHVAYRLPHSLREAISRPIFAILLAIATRRDANATPRSTGELLSDLVRYALGRAVPQPGEISPLKDELERLSVTILTRGGAVPTVEVAPVGGVAPLVSSGLVILQRGTLRFALDILLEWFGAQALRNQRITSQQLLADERLLERWFYPLAMFVAEASHDEATTFLGPITRAYPTMASQIVEEALESHDQRALLQEDETQPPPYDECGRRLRETMQAWADGLGPLSQLIAPLDGEGQLLPVGVAVGRSIYLRSWYEGEEPIPPVVELPSQLVETSPFSPVNRNLLGWEWRSLRWDKVGSSPAWAWDATRDELRRYLSEVIRAQGFPLDKGELRGGPLWTEIVWLSALWTMGYGRFYMQSLPLDALESRLEQMPADYDAISQYGKRTLTLAPLREEVSRLRAAGSTELPPPYPGPDEYSPNGWWRDPETGKKHRPERFITVGSSWLDNFSDEGLAAHVGAIYSAALQGYKQLVRTWLPTLAPHLTTAVLLPARLVGYVKHPWHESLMFATMRWHLEPLPLGSESRIEVRARHPEDEDDFHSEELMTSLRRLHLTMRPRAARWLVTSLHGEVISMGDTPALELAYTWLKDDLKHAGWIE